MTPMPLFGGELLTQLLIHAGFLLTACAFLVREILWLRVLAILANLSVAAAVYRSGADANWIIIAWATAFVLINAGHSAWLLYERHLARLSDDERRLPVLNEGETANRQAVDANQHFTQPPPRYSEASLVKKLEELGIGRPSTYASTIQVLQDRDYVTLDKRRFIPVDKGRLVTAFLTSFFTRYVEYDFTARMEEKLDEISDGQIEWKAVLRDFWDPFSAVAENTQELRTRAVLDSLDEELGPHFFPDREDGSDPRLCRACGEGRLGLRLGRHGPFIGCSGYPECRFTRRLSIDGDDDEGADVAAGPKVLGLDPETGKEVSLRKGPYGLYVQLGEAEGKQRPKRSSLPDRKSVV